MFDTYLTAQKKETIILIAVIVLLLMGYLDYVTGFEYAFSLFYILPVLFVTWYIGKRTGVVFSAASAITWHMANSLAGETYSSYYVPIWNASLRLGFFLIIIWSFARSKHLMEREKHLANTDFLTGAWNSRAFREHTNVEINQTLVTQKPFSLAYFDLDNFKFVNDTYGHRAGDAILVNFVQTAQAQTRTTDILARLGGDEFVLLLPNTPGPDAQEIVHRIQEKFRDIMVEQENPVTISAGVVTYMAQPPTNIDGLLRAADDAMYAAKREGKNRVYATEYMITGDHADGVHRFEAIDTCIPT